MNMKSYASGLTVMDAQEASLEDLKTGKVPAPPRRTLEFEGTKGIHIEPGFRFYLSFQTAARYSRMANGCWDSGGFHLRNPGLEIIAAFEGLHFRGVS